MPLVPCSSCKAVVSLPDDWLETSFLCPHCGEDNVIARPRPPKRKAGEKEVAHVQEVGSVGTGFGRGFGGTFGVIAAIVVILIATLTVFLGCPAIDKVREASRRTEEINKSKLNAVGPGEWSQLGDTRVGVSSVALQKVPLETIGRARYETSEPELMVWVAIENLSQTKKLDYYRWSSDFRNRVTAQDEHGNKYSLIDHDNVVDAKRYATIHPGDPPAKDVLCFERPVAAATTLWLTLPALGDARGNYSFAIPASAWKK